MPEPAATLARLSALAEAGLLDEHELARAKRRALEEASVGDVRAVGPARRGRTLAVAVDVLEREGEPTSDAIDWLEQAVERFDVAIVGGSEREADRRAWLRSHGLSEHALARIRFPRHKPPADVYLSRRALRFEGRFPSLDEIARLEQSAQDPRADGVQPVSEQPPIG